MIVAQFRPVPDLYATYSVWVPTIPPPRREDSAHHVELSPLLVGFVRHDHGIVCLTYDTVVELRDLLQRFAGLPEHRQHALRGACSYASFTWPVPSRLGRRVA